MFTVAVHAAPPHTDGMNILPGRAAPSQTLPRVGMGKPGFPIPLRGGGVGKPGFPTPFAEGLCSRQESRDDSGGVTLTGRNSRIRMVTIVTTGTVSSAAKKPPTSPPT